MSSGRSRRDDRKPSRSGAGGGGGGGRNRYRYVQFYFSRIFFIASLFYLKTPIVCHLSAKYHLNFDIKSCISEEKTTKSLFDFMLTRKFESNFVFDMVLSFVSTMVSRYFRHPICPQFKDIVVANEWPIVSLFLKK